MRYFDLTSAMMAGTREKTQIPLLLLVGSTASAIGLSISLVGALMPEICTDLGLGETQAGLAQSIFFLGHIAGILFAGRLLGRCSTSQLWMVATVSTALGVGICLSGGFLQLLLGRTLAGFGLSLSVILVSSLLVSQAAERAGSLLSAFHATVAASASLALLLAPMLSSLLGSWRMTIGLATILCLLPVVLCLLVPIPMVGTHRTGETNHQGSSLAAFLALIFIVAAYVSTEQIITVFMPLVLSNSESTTVAGQITALFWGGVIVGRVLGVLGGTAIPERTMLVAGGLTMTGSLILLAAAGSSWMIAGFAFLAGLGGGPLVPVGFAMAARWAKNPSTGVLACQAACFLGGLFGPTTVGVSANAVGLSSELLAIFGLAPAIGCLVFLISTLKFSVFVRLPQVSRS